MGWKFSTGRRSCVVPKSVKERTTPAEQNVWYQVYLPNHFILHNCDKQRKHFRAYLKGFSSDTPQCMNVRTRPKQWTKAEFIPRSQMQLEMHQSEEKINWHCVLNTNQLAGYSGKINRVNWRVQVRKRKLVFQSFHPTYGNFQQCGNQGLGAQPPL